MAHGMRRRQVRLLLGGLIGAAVVVDRRRRRTRLVPGDLRAFESAPCYLEDHGRRPTGSSASDGEESGSDGSSSTSENVRASASDSPSRDRK
jgi:hypothetical protein